MKEERMTMELGRNTYHLAVQRNEDNKIVRVLGKKENHGS